MFAGLENREIAECLCISERTVKRARCFSKAWLLAEFATGKAGCHTNTAFVVKKDGPPRPPNQADR